MSTLLYVGANLDFNFPVCSTNILVDLITDTGLSSENKVEEQTKSPTKSPTYYHQAIGVMAQAIDGTFEETKDEDKVFWQHRNKKKNITIKYYHNSSTPPGRLQTRHRSLPAWVPANKNFTTTSSPQVCCRYEKFAPSTSPIRSRGG